MAVRRTLAQADQTTSGLAALHWLEDDHRPRMIASQRLRLLWSNPAARAFLATNGLIVERRGELSGADESQQRALEQLVGAAAGAPATSVFRRDEGDAEALCVVQARSVATPGGQLGIGLQARQISTPHRYGDQEHLIEMFRLTAAEYQVLLDLMSGLTAVEVSDKRGSSVETIRTQIREIYAKLGVNSREKLFFRVNGLSF